MRTTTRKAGHALVASLACAAMAIGALTLSESDAQARPPILLCGPTYLWVCSGPGGPDVLFAGTICEKRAFEKQSGLSCVPY